MEIWEKEHVNNNIVELIENTICSVDLITRLKSAKVLSSTDVNLLEVQTITSFEKCLKMYEILQTRVNSYEVLVQCLNATRQSGAVKILNDLTSPFGVDGKSCNDQSKQPVSGLSETKILQLSGFGQIGKKRNKDCQPTNSEVTYKNRESNKPSKGIQPITLPLLENVNSRNVFSDTDLTSSAKDDTLYQQKEDSAPNIGNISTSEVQQTDDDLKENEDATEQENATPGLKTLLIYEGNCIDLNGNNSLFRAVISGHSRSQLEGIVKLGEDWKTKNWRGETVLHLAAQNGNVEALKYFISLGAYVGSADNVLNTVLQCVNLADRNYLASIRLLLDKGESIHSVSRNGNNFILLAAAWGRSKNDLEELVELGCEWKRKNAFRQSIVHILAGIGHVGATKYFIGLGANVNRKDRHGETPLHRVRFARQRFAELVEVLISNGAVLNAKSVSGETLHSMLKTMGRHDDLNHLTKYGIRR